MKRQKNRKSADGDSRLQELVGAARDGAARRLSTDCRSTILDEALKPEHAEGLRTLFTPTRHLLVAGALPAVLAVALLVGFDPGVQPPVTGTDRVPDVAVSKVDGRVLFDIRNGGKPHTVYRSTDPRDLASGRGVQVTGGYEERLQDQADLVFYRID